MRSLIVCFSPQVSLTSIVLVTPLILNYLLIFYTTPGSTSGCKHGGPPCLQALLPSTADRNYNLIDRLHNRQVPGRMSHLTDCNFTVRMLLFCGSYWLYCFLLSCIVQLRSDNCSIKETFDLTDLTCYKQYWTLVSFNLSHPAYRLSVSVWSKHIAPATHNTPGQNPPTRNIFGRVYFQHQTC